MKTMRLACLLLALPPLLMAACELEEVAAPPAEDVLVVEAILRAGTPHQYVLLHRSIEGTLVRGEPGASVRVTPAGGNPITYVASEVRECIKTRGSIGEGDEAIDLQASCYIAPAGAGFFVQPGQTYDLHVQTRNGLLARGRTTLPRGFNFVSPTDALDPQTLTRSCALPNTPFDLTWRKADGAWSYVVMMRLNGWSRIIPVEDENASDPLDLLSVSVSASDTTARVPVNIGLFQRGEIDSRIFEVLAEGIPPGIATTLVVMAADRNYTNAIRGGRFNPSGTVRLSSVAGDAVGVFGGVVPIQIHSDPRIPPGEGSPAPAPPRCSFPPT